MAAKKRSSKKDSEPKAEQEPKESQQEPKEPQQEPEQDSGLQTPQPDQPLPTEVERREQEPRKDDSDSEPRPLEDEQASDPDEQPAQPEEHVKHVNQGGRSFRADVRIDNHAELEERRRAELDRAREVHNQRTANVIGVLA